MQSKWRYPSLTLLESSLSQLLMAFRYKIVVHFCCYFAASTIPRRLCVCVCFFVCWFFHYSRANVHCFIAVFHWSFHSFIRQLPSQLFSTTYLFQTCASFQDRCRTFHVVIQFASYSSVSHCTYIQEAIKNVPIRDMLVAQVALCHLFEICGKNKNYLALLWRFCESGTII